MKNKKKICTIILRSYVVGGFEQCDVIRDNVSADRISNRRNTV
jgi:hypothetical protein